MAPEVKARASHWVVTVAQAAGGWCWGTVELQDTRNRALWRRKTPTFTKGADPLSKATAAAETDFINASSGFGLDRLTVYRQTLADQVAEPASA